MKLRRVIAALLGAAAAFGVMSLTSQAHAATVPAPTAQMVTACEAYRTYYYDRTAAHANAMVTATFTGDWTAKGAVYIIRDVTQYYTDIRTGAAAKYIAEDQKYLGEDCNRYVLPWER